MNASELAKMRQDRRKHSVAIVQPVRVFHCPSHSATMPFDQVSSEGCYRTEKSDHITAPCFNRATHSNSRVHHSSLRRSSRTEPAQIPNHPLHQSDLHPTQGQKSLQRNHSQTSPQSEKASRKSRPTQCPCSDSASSSAQKHNRLAILGPARPRNHRRGTVRRCDRKR